MANDLTISILDKGVCHSLQLGVFCEQRVKLQNIFADDRGRGCVTSVSCYGQCPLIDFATQRPAYELIR